jgi:hypothetical protein
VMAFPGQVSLGQREGIEKFIPTRMKEKPMQVPVTALTM